MIAVQEQLVKSNGYQLLPALRDEEYQALKADIRERGVLVPIEVDEGGHILDGHHRIRAWTELRAEGVRVPDYNRLIRVGLTEADKRNHVRVLNLLRRHLGKDELREQIIEMRKDGATLQEIAKATGVSPQTVMRATDSTIPNGKVEGKDGKARPAKYAPRKPKTVLATSKTEETKAQDAIAKAGDNLPDKTVTVNRAARIGREAEATKRGEAVKGDVAIGKVSCWLGDFRERGQEIADASVDLIFTDPPYPREFLPLWSDLSAFAARVLKPNGMLIAYTGAMDLPEVMQRLGESLQYWWMGSIVLAGPHSRVHARNIAQGCKPLLFYVREGFKPDGWLEDTYKSEGEQKDAHEWQQSLGCALYYIEKLVPNGGLVVDPFLGGGTTAVASQRLGRNFIGTEIDRVALAAAEERIKGEPRQAELARV